MCLEPKIVVIFLLLALFAPIIHNLLILLLFICFVKNDIDKNKKKIQ
jgi:hypothetical protein